MIQIGGHLADRVDEIPGGTPLGWYHKCRRTLSWFNTWLRTSISAPLMFMYMLLLMVNTLLRDSKDTLLVTSAAGVEAIPILKSWVVIPASFLYFVVYYKLSLWLSPRQLFITIIIGFNAFYFAFAWTLFAKRKDFVPLSTTEWLREVLPVNAQPLRLLIENWLFGIFYVVSELWASAVCQLMFWKVANEIVSVDHAKGIYPLIGAFGNLGMVAAGYLLREFANERDIVAAHAYLRVKTSRSKQLKAVRQADEFEESVGYSVFSDLLLPFTEQNMDPLDQAWQGTLLGISLLMILCSVVVIIAYDIVHKRHDVQVRREQELATFRAINEIEINTNGGNSSNRNLPTGEIDSAKIEDKPGSTIIRRGSLDNNLWNSPINGSNAINNGSPDHMTGATDNLANGSDTHHIIKRRTGSDHGRTMKIMNSAYSEESSSNTNANGDPVHSHYTTIDTNNTNIGLNQVDTSSSGHDVQGPGTSGWVNTTSTSGNLSSGSNDDSLQRTNSADYQKKSKKGKVSMIQALRTLANSTPLRCAAILVVSYGISISLVEVSWKGQVKKALEKPNDYSRFMGMFWQLTGLVSMAFMLIGRVVLQRVGYAPAVLFTPICMAVAGSLFFMVSIVSDLMSGPSAVYIADSIPWAAYFGGAAVLFAKAAKYAFFDATKEIIFIPLDASSKNLGKAAIDVVAYRLSKSGGSVILQLVMIIFGSISSSAGCTPIAIVFGVVVLAWIHAALTANSFIHDAQEDNKRTPDSQHIV
mmetsp:Transcript_17117/g.33519  ORF Transcript_17117/g.33519 Transcript_17117/m.33519 type:complete len:754 (+) Transcript_17117:680-2941(+)